jgi:hypothetical protein
VRAVLWSLFTWLAWARSGTVLAGTRVEGAVLDYVRLAGRGSEIHPGGYRSEWAQAANVVAGTKGEGAAPVYIRSIGVGSASHCGGGHDRLGHYSGLCYVGRRGLSQPLLWRARHATARLWPLFAWSTFAQPVTVVAGTIVEGAVLVSVRLVGVGPSSHCGGGHDS